MSYIIRTSSEVIASVNSELSSANSTLSANESFRNSTGSNIKNTIGFSCLKHVTVTPQRAANPSLTAVSLLDTEKSRILKIHDRIEKSQSSSS
jgi:hypothetical protein